MLRDLFAKLFPKSQATLDPEKMPSHVAIIMDGNGRWATRRGLPRVAGHRAGAEALKRCVRACADLGIKNLTVYAFSTENWERPKDEVNFLMSLFSEMIDRELAGLKRNKVWIRFLGRLSRLPKELQDKIAMASDETREGAKFNLNIMVNYGGRAEIVDAVNSIVKEMRDLPAGRQGGRREIGEGDISKNLYTAGLPDPDLVIRTAWERRISNFMLWQIAYSELYFTKTLWPDFGMEALKAAVLDYQGRQRRFGRI